MHRISLNDKIFKNFNFTESNFSPITKSALYPAVPVEQTKPKAENSSKKVVPAVLASLAFCGAIVGGILYASKKHKIGAVKTDVLDPILDAAYKSKLVQGLKDFYGLEVEQKALNSVMGPEEFSRLIKKFKPEQFQAGLQGLDEKLGGYDSFKKYEKAVLDAMPKEELEKFYKNAIEGNFRISLHTHSNFSDGKATVGEFLECAKKYADKVAGKNPSDGLPPFTIALSDHDNVEGCREIIKLIAQNPENYQNLKFVAGCEFSVSNNIPGFCSHHDITGLALDPFDKNLNKMLDEIRDARMQTATDFLNGQTEFNGKKVMLQDLIDLEKMSARQEGKSGKRTLENASGIVFVRHVVQFFNKLTGRNVGGINKLGDRNILPIQRVIDTIKESGGYTSLTHPIKSFWGYIGDNELLKLKKMGVDGIEVNHQYTPSKFFELKSVPRNKNLSLSANELFDEISEKYRKFAQENNMFISGGTDSHEKQIFSRQPKFRPETGILDKILN